MLYSKLTTISNLTNSRLELQIQRLLQVWIFLHQQEKESIAQLVIAKITKDSFHCAVAKKRVVITANSKSNKLVKITTWAIPRQYQNKAIYEDTDKSRNKRTSTLHFISPLQKTTLYSVLADKANTSISNHRYQLVFA